MGNRIQLGPPPAGFDRHRLRLGRRQAPERILQARQLRPEHVPVPMK